MTDNRATTEDISVRLQKMEAMQMNHLRKGMFLLIYFTVAFSCLAWEWIKHVSKVFELLPIATVVVICVWVACVAKHSRDLARLRKLAESAAPGTLVSEANEELANEHEAATHA